MSKFYRFSHFKKYPRVLHAVSQKVEERPYSLSLALHTGEEKNIIVKNRQEILRELGWNSSIDFIVAHQTHSDHIKIIEKKMTLGWKSNSDAVEDCDALITDVADVVLTILTADCVPILLYDPSKEVVAAVHAGWKGTQKQIVEKTVEKMVEKFSCDVADIRAGIAPSIGQCCYEVGEDVAKYFYDNPKVCKEKNSKYMLDLPAINKKQLLKSGIKEKHIEMSHICTSCHVENYFSYRKEKGCTGRFMSMISLSSQSSK